MNLVHILSTCVRSAHVYRSPARFVFVVMLGLKVDVSIADSKATTLQLRCLCSGPLLFHSDLTRANLHSNQNPL